MPELRDKDGNVVANIDHTKAPYTFVEKFIWGEKEYKICWNYKTVHTPEGKKKDLGRITGVQMS